MSTLDVLSMQGALQTHALMSARTGSPIWDTLLFVLFSAIIGNILHMGGSFSDAWDTLCGRLFRRRRSVLFQGRIYYKCHHYTNMTDRFVAVSDWVQEELDRNQFEYATHLREMQVPRHLRRSSLMQDNRYFRGEREADDECTFFNNGLYVLDQHQEVHHRKHPIVLEVRCRDQKEEEPSGSNRLISSSNASGREYYDCSIQISSSSMSLQELNAFVKRHILDAFVQRAKEMREGKLTYNIFTRRDEDSGTLLFDKYPWKSTKRYEHVVSEHTAHVKEQVTRFLNSSEEYERCGKPYRLSILLHGPPGCGKTSLIKAVANATRRHVIDISLPRIKNRQTLMDLFHDNGCTKPSETIFVIDDMDRMGSVVEKDGQKEDSSPPTNLPSEVPSLPTPVIEAGDDAEQHVSKAELKVLLAQLGITSTPSGGYAMQVSPREEPPLIRSDLMNVMDGLLEMNGTILFITANHPENIDPAILRPGRINMRLKMGYANEDTLRTMLHSAFPSNSCRAEIEACALDEFAGKLAPAHLESIIQNSTSVQTTLAGIRQALTSEQDALHPPTESFERIKKEGGI